MRGPSFNRSSIYMRSDSFFFVSLEMSLFFEHHVPVPFTFGMESTLYVPLPDGVFYLVITGWILASPYVRIKIINQSMMADSGPVGYFAREKTKQSRVEFWCFSSKQGVSGRSHHRFLVRAHRRSSGGGTLKCWKTSRVYPELSFTLRIL